MGRFLLRLTQRENALLVDALRKTGHGHPRTFLNYYFAIGDLLLSVFAAASLKNHQTVRSLTALSAGGMLRAYRNAFATTSRVKAEFDAWAWLSRHAASKCGHLPQFFDQEAAVSLEEPKRNLAVRPRPEPDDAKSLVSSAQYLAVRMVGMSLPAASARLHLSGCAILSLEACLAAFDLTPLSGQHQLSANQRLNASARNDIGYLLSDEGRIFAHQLMGADPRILECFFEALDHRHTRKVDAIDVQVFTATFKAFTRCLPDSLGLLVQFGKGRITARDALKLSNLKDRVHIDRSEAALGNQPRISVILKDKPKHYVARARRTANTRYLIQAVRLLNSGVSN
jgi:hypothetical protein